MLRLILVLILFLLSLLVLFPAPTSFAWLLSVMVTEFPWIFMAVAAVLMIWALNAERYKAVSLLLSVVSFLIYLYPTISAYAVGSKLTPAFEAAFGSSSTEMSGLQQETPFSFGRMISGIAAPKTAYTTYTYGNTDNTELTLDFYKAQATGNRPCVVVVHGGSWSAGNSQQLPEINSYLARQGYNVASINYRMAPEHKSPAQVEDVATALSYLKVRAGALNIDTNNFVLLGRSAGGQIVLVAAYALHEPGVKAVVSLYGPTDMVWAYNHPSNPWVLNTPKTLGNFLGGSDKEQPQKYYAATAMNFVTPQTVPTLLIHGEHDPLVNYKLSEMLDSKLAENKVPHLLLSLPWATHGCEYTLNGPSGQLFKYAIERFVKKVTSGK